MGKSPKFRMSIIGCYATDSNRFKYKSYNVNCPSFSVPEIFIITLHTKVVLAIFNVSSIQIFLVLAINDIRL